MFDGRDHQTMHASAPLEVRGPEAVGTSADEQRIWASLIKRRERRVLKRHLQQRLHRLPASRLNHGLEGLLRKGFVRRSGLWVEVVWADAHEKKERENSCHSRVHP